MFEIRDTYLIYICKVKHIFFLARVVANRCGKRGHLLLPFCDFFALTFLSSSDSSWKGCHRLSFTKSISIIENTSTMNTAECLKTWMDQTAVNPETTGRARAVSDSTSDRPSVKTDNSYDDDESFTMASLNLLSKHEYLSLTPRDAILNV